MRNMKEIDQSALVLTEEILHRLHEIQLEMLKDLDAFCEQHQIRYCLSSGTLLGAVRDKGFLPWDDDVDVSMPRADFEKFLSLRDQLPKKYVCQATRFDVQFPLTVAKLQKNGTILREPSMGHLDIHHGVWIDIFPLDRVQNIDKLDKRAHRQRLLKSAIAYRLKNWCPESFRGRLICKFLSVFGVRRLDQWRTRVMTAEEDSDATMLTSFASGLGHRNLLFDESVYFPLQKIPFEDTTLYAPADPDRWLSSAFGDYMTPPPKEKQVNKHPIIEIKL